MRSLLTLGLRWVALTAFAVWFGGFTFYAAVVIPVLHEELGGLGQGGITGEVSKTLNGIGVGTVVALGVLAWVERSIGERRARWGRVGLLALTTAILIGLMVLHPILEARLDSGSMHGFHGLHQVYLIATTAQWFVNLAWLGVTLRIWRGTGRGGLTADLKCLGASATDPRRSFRDYKDAPTRRALARRPP